MAVCVNRHCACKEIRKNSRVPWLQYCGLCGTYSISPEARSAGKLRLPDLLAALIALAGPDSVFESRIVPLALSVCSPAYHKLMLAVGMMLRQGNTHEMRFYRSLTDSSVSFGDVLASDIAAEMTECVNCDIEDAAYIVRSYAFAFGRLQSIEDYSVERYSDATDSVRGTNLSLTVSEKVVRRGQTVELKWRVEMERPVKGRRPKHRPVVFLIRSGGDGRSESIVGEKGSQKVTLDVPARFTLGVRIGSTVKDSVSLDVNVAEEVCLGSFRASSHSVIENEPVRLMWNLAGAINAALRFEESNGVTHDVDVTAQVGQEFIFSPSRDVTVILEARGEFGSRVRSALHIGVRRLPRFPSSRLAVPDIDISRVEMPRLGSLWGDGDMGQIRRDAIRKVMEARRPRTLAARMSALTQEIVSLIKQVVYVKI